MLLDLLEEPPLELLPGEPARAGQRVIVQHQVGVGPLPLGVHPVREGVHLEMTKMSIDGGGEVVHSKMYLDKSNLLDMRGYVVEERGRLGRCRVEEGRVGPPLRVELRVLLPRENLRNKIKI